jgi:hypothetical protein
MDAGESNIRQIIKSPISWKYDLRAVCAFITKENINSLITANIGEGDIGLLAIDIDGNDYWVWNAINVISPRIVICEYNSVFGDEHSFTIPYREDFARTKAHYSNLYWGASLPALCHLAEKKGYYCVGSTSAGNNAFFVRKDVLGNLTKCHPKEAYVESRIRESRDRYGQLSYIAGKNRLIEIADMELWNIKTEKMILIKDLVGRLL